MMKDAFDEREGAATSFRFEQQFLPHLDAAYNLARWLLSNDQDAEDSVQEAYMRAFNAYSRFRGTEGNGKAWLMTIVRNVCYTALKKKNVLELSESFEEEVHYSKEDVEKTELFRQHVQAESLRRALEKLPDDFREIIVLHDLESLTYKEISSVMSIPLGTVMSRLARARTRLRKEILKDKEFTYDL